MLNSQVHAFRQAQRDADQIKNTLMATATAVHDVNGKLNKIRSASESPQTEAGLAPSASPPPRARPATEAGLALPALPDVTRQVEIFVAIATRNQETILRALKQVTALCARQQSQHEALVREVERVNARAVHLSLLR